MTELTAQTGHDISEIRLYANRVMNSQDVSRGTTLMHVYDEHGTYELTPVPPLHVAAVLHALADHTHNLHMVNVIVGQRSLAVDETYAPEATSLGRYFHRLADDIELRVTELEAQPAREDTPRTLTDAERWKMAAEVVLERIEINEVPALEFIQNIVDLGDKLAAEA